MQPRVMYKHMIVELRPYMEHEEYFK